MKRVFFNEKSAGFITFFSESATTMGDRYYLTYRPVMTVVLSPLQPAQGNDRAHSVGACTVFHTIKEKWKSGCLPCVCVCCRGLRYHRVQFRPKTIQKMTDRLGRYIDRHTHSALLFIHTLYIHTHTGGSYTAPAKSSLRAPEESSSACASGEI